MSRSYNEQDSDYRPMHTAKKFAKKSARAQSSRILANIKKAKDPDEVPDKVFDKSRTSKGDVWTYD
jgi:hypothetical protein